MRLLSLFENKDPSSGGNNNVKYFARCCACGTMQLTRILITETD
jgi:hypothetical protein